jgi:hypothetical protein
VRRAREPEWLATCEIKHGTLKTPACKALRENFPEREKRIMSSVGPDRLGRIRLPRRCGLEVGGARGRSSRRVGRQL